ncbi:FtsX-like permease family protein [Actinomadura sp. 7K507]|uniref:ABC transporter permease n=1 Tax=Actinomadura sp. 7K507 TaxID=2530365 RepID=UPI0010494D6A|nr:FtsX-like permease family protein [Actinomadura sp. 7K507]TDC84789.1 FtsX-like permease family protein [Actinomadura sp. 7K507]
MTGIALRVLRFHKGGFLASFAGLFLGALIVVGCGGLLETGIRADAPPQRMAAAPIVVTGDQRYHGTVEELIFPERARLDAALTAKIGAVPGVAAVVPDVSFPAALASHGAVTGHNWASARLAPHRLAQGAAPSGPGQIVLGEDLAERAGLRTGGRVELLVNGAAERFQIVGLAAGTGDVFVAGTEAGRLAGRPGKIDSVGVLLARGADAGGVARAVESAVGATAAGAGPAVLTGDDRGRAEDPGLIEGTDDLIPLAAAFGSLAALAMVFVVAGTVGLSIRQRERETALLRAVGATPGQLRRMILAETMILAVAATALACWPAPWFGQWLLKAFVHGGVVSDAVAFRSGAFPLIAGAGLALTAALGAAFMAAHQAARTRPAEALAEAALQRRWFSVVRLVLGVLCLGGGAALAVGTAGSDGPDAGGVATPAALVWTIAFGLLGPVLARAINAALTRPVRALSGLAGELATANARARTARLTTAVMPVMLATGLALSLTYLQTTQSDGNRRAFEQAQRADLVLTSAAGGVPLDAVETVRNVPGVAAATARIPSRGFVEPATAPAPSGGGDGGEEEESAGPQPTELALQGITPQGADRTTAYRAATGALTALKGDTVALPTRYATGHRLGDTIAMRLGDGTRTRLRLVATVDARRGYETALVPAALLAPHTGTGLVPQILISADPGTDRTALSAALTSIGHPGLQLTDRHGLAAAQQDQDQTQATMAWLVLAVVVGYAVISLVNTQALATAERRREFGLMRLVGATRRQILRMMAVEASLVAAAGIALGLLIAAFTLIPAGLSVLGSAVPGGPPWILTAIVAAALGLTILTTLAATRITLRGGPGSTG